MKICVAFSIRCSADAAWHAAHSPARASKVYAPVFRMESTTGTFPDQFVTGAEVPARMSLFGVIPLGSQMIRITDTVHESFPPGSRTMWDHGSPLTGPLALLRSWNHQITVIPISPTVSASAENSRPGVQADGVSQDQTNAFWHDELTITGWAAPLMAPVLWAVWKWRAGRIQSLSRYWKYMMARSLRAENSSTLLCPNTHLTTGNHQGLHCFLPLQ